MCNINFCYLRSYRSVQRKGDAKHAARRSRSGLSVRATCIVYVLGFYSTALLTVLCDLGRK